MTLSEYQIGVIDITEKTGSILSVLGEAFVIATFLFSSNFRKPVNRLVFYAAWGNALSNVATIIGRSAINIGLESPLCQFQAFLIQWFMPADALWTFAMACNVWLSFFRHYDAQKLRALEWKYLLLCYGLPFAPAFVFLFVANQSRGRVFGDATLWCWVSVKWDFLRVAAFYAPVWVVIILTMGIYLRVGVLICRWRQQLITLGKSEEEQRCQMEQIQPSKGIRRTDEVTVTTEATMHSPPHAPSPNPSPVEHDHQKETDLRPGTGLRGRAASGTPRTGSSKGTFQDASRQANKATIQYCKCAMLFFLALLVTWVPSTVNRINSIVNPSQSVFGLQFAAALVLPLQGFWNAVIYISTSGFACKCLWQDTLTMLGLRKPPITAVPPGHVGRGLSLDSRGGWPTDSETNSLKPIRSH